MPEKTSEPGRKPARKPKPEVVEQIPLSELRPFPDHLFQVRDDDTMQETAESIKTYDTARPIRQMLPAKKRSKLPSASITGITGWMMLRQTGGAAVRV